MEHRSVLGLAQRSGAALWGHIGDLRLIHQRQDALVVGRAHAGDQRDHVGVGNQLLHVVFGARGVVANPHFRVDQQAEQVRAQRHLHVQQRIETAASEFFSDRLEAGDAYRLVEGDELDASNIANQFPLQLADDPSQPGLRPVCLQCAHQRHDMAGIAQRRCAQQAQ